MATMQKPVASQEQILACVAGSLQKLGEVMQLNPAEILGALNALRVEQEMMYQQQVVRTLQEQQRHREQEARRKLEEQVRNAAEQKAAEDKKSSGDAITLDPNAAEPSASQEI